MALFKSEDERGGTLFVGCLLLGVGAGMLASILTNDWLYVGVGSVFGVGVAFIAIALLGRK